MQSKYIEKKHSVTQDDETIIAHHANNTDLSQILGCHGWPVTGPTIEALESLTTNVDVKCAGVDDYVHRRGSSNFCARGSHKLLEDRTSYVTRLFRDMLQSTKQACFFVNMLFFHDWQNGLMGQIGPAGRSLETPDYRVSRYFYAASLVNRKTACSRVSDLSSLVRNAEPSHA